MVNSTLETAPSERDIVGLGDYTPGIRLTRRSNVQTLYMY